jgi:hypothetical protein
MLEGGNTEDSPLAGLVDLLRVAKRNESGAAQSHKQKRISKTTATEEKETHLQQRLAIVREVLKVLKYLLHRDLLRPRRVLLPLLRALLVPHESDDVDELARADGEGEDVAAGTAVHEL